MPCSNHTKAPSRASTCVRRPSARRRAQSTPIVLPIQQSKKPRSRAVPVAPLEPSMSLPLVQAAPEEPIVREENLEDEQEVYLSAAEDDDVADATLNKPIESEDSEERPIEFMSSWRAIAGKEQLPGVKSAVLREGSLSLYSIEAWKQEMITRLLPRRFKVVKLEAICSYERCKQLDECPQDITTHSDVYTVLEVLKA